MRTPQAPSRTWPSRARATKVPPGSEAEAWLIIRYIRPFFESVAATYDTSKYWPDVYARAVAEFQHPATVSEHTIREALLWKWGHLGKSRIPATHTNLIALAASCWPQITATPLSSPRASFDRLRGAIGTGNRFITVAFLTHLLHPEAVPIIDQHNFRALNALLAMVRHDWPIKKRPSRYENIELLSDVMAAILRTWKRRAPRSIPTRSQLDRFLMMCGKSLQRTQRRTEGTNGD